MVIFDGKLSTIIQVWRHDATYWLDLTSSAQRGYYVDFVSLCACYRCYMKYLAMYPNSVAICMLVVEAFIEHSLSHSDQMCCHLLHGNLSVTREFLPHTDRQYSTGNEVLPAWVNLNISLSITGQIRDCRVYLTATSQFSIFYYRQTAWCWPMNWSTQWCCVVNVV